MLTYLFPFTHSSTFRCRSWRRTTSCRSYWPRMSCHWRRTRPFPSILISLSRFKLGIEMFLTHTPNPLFSCVWIYSQRTKRKKDITEHKDRTLSPSPPFQVLILINQLHITVWPFVFLLMLTLRILFSTLFFLFDTLNVLYCSLLSPVCRSLLWVYCTVAFARAV